MNCLNCDKELVQMPGKRAKQFCNSTCRSNYWQKEKRASKKTSGNQVEKKEPKLEYEKSPVFKNAVEKMLWEAQQKQKSKTK